jgi:hypothetical protein
MSLEASGNLLVGTTTSSGRLSIKASGTATYAATFKDSTNTLMSGFYVGESGITGGYNGANCVQWIARDATTSRSINAGGTINASGADAAEYERNGGLKIAKGQIVGFGPDGVLTDRFDLAIRFGVKSTDPHIVGGDTWGTEDKIGKRPDEPKFKPPEYTGRTKPEDLAPEPQAPAVFGLTEPVPPEDPDDAVAAAVYAIALRDFNAAKAAWEESDAAYAVAHAEWQEKAEQHARDMSDWNVDQVEHKARTDIERNLFDTATYPEYLRDKAAFEERLEAARQQVDRVAYCGKVPCNVQGATPGDYIVAVNDGNGGIKGLPVRNPTFEQYRAAVGRVNRILPDGRAEIAVIVH